MRDVPGRARSEGGLRQVPELCSAKALKSALSGAICSRRGPGADGLTQAPAAGTAIRLFCGEGPDTASAPRDGAGKSGISHAGEKTFQPFFWLSELAFKQKHSSSVPGQRSNSSWFSPYSRAQESSFFVGSKCSLEKANFSRQSTSKASERSALLLWE